MLQESYVWCGYGSTACSLCSCPGHRKQPIKSLVHIVRKCGWLQHADAPKPAAQLHSRTASNRPLSCVQLLVPCS
jgi:hypothetical protein